LIVRTPKKRPIRWIRRSKTAQVQLGKKNVVHLGNVGDDRAYRSKMLAERFSNFNFYGIDLKGLRSKRFLHFDAEKNPKLKVIRKSRLKKKKPENLEQIKADFNKGLSRFPDNSVDIITSDFAVGFYKEEKTYRKVKKNAKAAKDISQQYVNIGSEEYTQKTFDLIYKKLKPKGKFIAYYFVERSGSNLYFKRNLDTALKKSNFLSYRTERVDVSKIPAQYRTLYTTHLEICDIYRIVAEK
jgi:hypothetical protein